MLDQVKHVIAVASGKGGVGKSTVAVNLALALAKNGQHCGLLDADIYGPSIPMMLGIKEKPRLVGEQLEPLVAFGLKTISMGLLAGEEAPVIWRGPMVASVVNQFLTQVDWGELDCLVIDLPPGTGDAQLTLTQKARISGALIVTTPQDLSLLDARRGIKMFQEVNVPVWGIVENMSYFICDQCSKRHFIFPPGGGEKISKELNIPLLCQLPIEPQIAVGGDSAKPFIIAHPASAASQVMATLAKKVLALLGEEERESNDAEEFHLEW